VVHGHQESVELLVGRGASATFQDRDGKSALHLAAACGHLSCLATLLGNTSEDVSELQDSQGYTVLHWACYNGMYRIQPLEPYTRNELTMTELHICTTL